MRGQDDLFGNQPSKPPKKLVGTTKPALSRSTDPHPSYDAAKKVKVNKLEQAVLDVIVAAGAEGATWDEVTARSGLDKASVSPRFRRLLEKGLITKKIKPDGKILTRTCLSGGQQTIWFAL